MGDALDGSGVGVVVPVYGWAPYLAETLDGILGQDPPPARVVVVDDGSREPVRLVPDHAGRCELMRSEHAGLANARAAGARALAELELLALCDADDTWVAGSFRARLDALTDHPEAAVCFGSSAIVGIDGRPTGERWTTVAAGVYRGREWWSLLMRRNPIVVSGAIVRRRALEAAGGFDSDLPAAEDLDLWLRMTARGDAFVSVPHAIVRQRRHPAAMTTNVTTLARAQLAVHRAHGAGLDPGERRQIEACDLAALADGLVREGRYGEARATLREAASLAPPGPRARALAVALAVPGLRSRLGRRDPYVR